LTYIFEFARYKYNKKPATGTKNVKLGIAGTPRKPCLIRILWLRELPKVGFPPDGLKIQDKTNFNAITASGVYKLNKNPQGTKPTANTTEDWNLFVANGKSNNGSVLQITHTSNAENDVYYRVGRVS